MNWPNFIIYLSKVSKFQNFVPNSQEQNQLVFLENGFLIYSIGIIAAIQNNHQHHQVGKCEKLFCLIKLKRSKIKIK